MTFRLDAVHKGSCHCGIYTHHQRRSKPDEYSFNIACLEEVNIFDIEGISHYDGIVHPNDR